MTLGNHFGLRSFWRPAAIGMATGAALAVVAVFIMRPTYRAETVLAPVKDRGGDSLGQIAGQLSGLAFMAGIDLGASANTDEALAVLRSRSLTETFIIREGLLPILFEERWDADRKAWIGDGKPPPTMFRAYEKFDRDVRKISLNKASGLVTLGIDWRDRKLAAQWANRLAEYANEEMRARAIRETDESLKFLNEEVEKTRVIEIREAIYRLIESQIKRSMLASVRREYAFKVIDPAVVPDVDRYVSPRRALLLALGLVLGFLGGIAAKLLWLSIRRGKDVRIGHSASAQQESRG